MGKGKNGTGGVEEERCKKGGKRGKSFCPPTFKELLPPMPFGFIATSFVLNDTALAYPCSFFFFSIFSYTRLHESSIIIIIIIICEYAKYAANFSTTSAGKLLTTQATIGRLAFCFN